MRKAVRGILGTVLVLSAAGCIDDPLSEGREDADRFRLNPSVAVVDAGGTTKITAIVVNQFGAAINAPVTAEPCDAKVSVAVDETRTEYEAPERFIVTGATLGESCVIVRGGGVEDTVTLRVVPASIRGTGVDTVLSGATKTIAVQFRNTAGATVAGFTNAQVTFTSLDPTIGAVSSTGVVSGQAPGTGRILVSTVPTTGAVRVDTVRYVVRAGTFSGTVTQGTAGAATNTTAAVSFTQGAIPFDADTQVRLLSGSTVVTTFLQPGAPAGTITLALPYGLPAGTYNYEVTNIGPNQVASVGTVSIAATPAEDPFGPDASAGTTTRLITGSGAIYGTLTATDTDDWIKLTITEAGSYRFSATWNDNSDVDVLPRNSTNTGYLTTAMATGAKPEVATVTLQPGSYWIWMNMYEWAPAGDRATTYQFTVTKQ